MAFGLLSNNRESPTWLVLEHLQRSGSATIKDLEGVLGVTTTAVRQHLATLQAEGYIQRRSVHAGVGRPHHVYELTTKAQELFGCHCDDLALTLLEEVFHLEGDERTAILLDRVGGRLAQKYADTVRSSVLQDRVQELAATLYDRGVIADVSAAADDSDDDTIVLQTYNCPYHELAQDHREICDMDQKMIRQVLGSDVDLKECLMDGHSSCTFVVSSGVVSGGEELPQFGTDISG